MTRLLILTFLLIGCREINHTRLLILGLPVVGKCYDTSMDFEEDKADTEAGVRNSYLVGKLLAYNKGNARYRMYSVNSKGEIISYFNFETYASSRSVPCPREK